MIRFHHVATGMSVLIITSYRYINHLTYLQVLWKQCEFVFF